MGFHLRLEVAGGRSDSGNAMIVALLILFLMTSLGISYVAVTRGDKQIAGNQMTASQAFEYAEARSEERRVGKECRL